MPSFRPAWPPSKGSGARCAALRCPQYRRFWLAELLNGCANWLLFAAQGWLLISLTHQAQMVALFFVLRIAPRVVIGIPAGALCDRYGSLRVLRLARLAGLAPALMVALAAVSGQLTADVVLLSAVLTSAIQAFDQPAHRSLVHTYAPGALIVSGVGAMATGNTLATVIGPVLLAPVSALAGVTWAFPLQAALVAASALVLLGNRQPETRPEPTEKSVGKDCLFAVRYLASTPLILLLIVLAGSPGMLDRLLAVATPGYADANASGGAAGMTLLFLAPATGALLGGSLLAWIGGEVRRLLPLAVGSSSVAMVSVGLLATTRLFVLSVILFLVLGAAKAAFSVVIMSALQRRVPEHARGRVMGL